LQWGIYESTPQPQEWTQYNPIRKKELWGENWRIEDFFREQIWSCHRRYVCSFFSYDSANRRHAYTYMHDVDLYDSLVYYTLIYTLIYKSTSCIHVYAWFIWLYYTLIYMTLYIESYKSMYKYTYIYTNQRRAYMYIKLFINICICVHMYTSTYRPFQNKWFICTFLHVHWSQFKSCIQVNSVICIYVYVCIHTNQRVGKSEITNPYVCWILKSANQSQIMIYL